MRSDINGSKDLRNGTLQVSTQDEQENEHVNEQVCEQVNRKAVVIAALKDNPKLTFKQIAEKANISYATARREMDVMREKGIIKRIGSDKTGHWKLSSYK